MIAWSSPLVRSSIRSNLRKCISTPKNNNAIGINQIQVRTCKSAGGSFVIIPSTFTWNKSKDLVKFYVTLIGVPFIALITYVNIFIGPATLKPIPEGYVPKHWEYHRNPITRFISQYLVENPQKEYEKMCYGWFYYADRKLVREVEKKVKNLISVRHDFQAWYFTPAYVKYSRKRAADLQKADETDNLGSGAPFYK